MDPTVIENMEYMKLIIGFLVGALIGLERQISEQLSERVEGEGRPGVRTFGLCSLLGTVSALFYTFPEASPAAYLALLFSVITATAIIVTYTVIRFVRNPRDIGITTSVALALAFLAGLLVGFGNTTLAITLAIFVTFILAIKRSTEKLLMNIEYEELSSALQIGILWMLIYPLVPDVEFLGSISVRTIYFFMLIVLGLSFIAYVSVKNLGPTRGVVAFTFIGSLVSSEATSVNLVRTLKRVKIDEEARRTTITAGVLLANSTMVLRILGLTALYVIGSIEVIKNLAIILVPPALIGIGVSLLRLRRVRVKGMPRMELGNPLSYKGAAKFTFLFLLVSVAVVLLQRIAADLGLLVASALGGLVSALAVSISIASLYLSHQISMEVAIEGITIGVIAAVMDKVIYLHFVEKPGREAFKMALVDMVLLALGIVLTFSLWKWLV